MSGRMMPVEELRRLYEYQPPLPPEQWPYRSAVTRNRYGGDVPRPDAEAGECPACVGRGLAWQVKNGRTGSKRLVRCARCNGSGKA